jgi:hypothetical protein
MVNQWLTKSLGGEVVEKSDARGMDGREEVIVESYW